MKLRSKASEHSAVFSACSRYRYVLRRQWGGGGLFDERPKVVCNFLMLNPSTADADSNDPTVGRCESYASRWGFTGIVVTNLFAFRSTDPEQLKRVPDPIGPENDETIIREASAADLVVRAWGEHGKILGRADSVVSFLRSAGIVLWALRINGSGQPAHPLYLPSILEPQPFED